MRRCEQAVAIGVSPGEVDQEAILDQSGPTGPQGGDQRRPVGGVRHLDLLLDVTRGQRLHRPAHDAAVVGPRAGLDQQTRRHAFVPHLAGRQGRRGQVRRQVEGEAERLGPRLRRTDDRDGGQRRRHLQRGPAVVPRRRQHRDDRALVAGSGVGRGSLVGHVALVVGGADPDPPLIDAVVLVHDEQVGEDDLVGRFGGDRGAPRPARPMRVDGCGRASAAATAGPVPGRVRAHSRPRSLSRVSTTIWTVLPAVCERIRKGWPASSRSPAARSARSSAVELQIHSVARGRAGAERSSLR